jgi:hypothetical protein
MNDFIERRKNKREKDELFLSGLICEVLLGKEKVSPSCIDLSIEGGCFLFEIKYDRFLSPSSSYNFSLKLPDGFVVNAFAKMIWKGESENYKFIAGFNFLISNKEEKMRLLDFYT